MLAETTKEEALNTLRRMRTAAETALADGVPALWVTVFREHPPSGETIRLAGESGPIGRLPRAVCIEPRQWKVTALFRAARLIQWTSEAIESILKG